MLPLGMVNDNDRLQTTARALNSGAIHLLRGMREIDRLTGLTPARLSALSVLVFGGAMPLGRLARAEGVAGPTMTRIVDGLAELGLARRERHPENGRIALISATEAGTQLMRAAAQRRIDAIATALAQLPAEQRNAVIAAAPLLDELATLVRANG